MGQAFAKIAEIRLIHLLKNLIILQMIEECMYFGEVYILLYKILIDASILNVSNFLIKKAVAGYSCFCIFSWLFNVKIIFKIISAKNGTGSFNNSQGTPRFLDKSGHNIRIFRQPTDQILRSSNSRKCH